MSGRFRADLAYVLRSNCRRPGRAAVAVVTLALGFAVNAASLAIAYGVLGRPLPYAEPSRIVVLDLMFADGGRLGFSPRALGDWLTGLRTVGAAAAYSTREVTIRSAGQTHVAPGAFVSAGFFDVFGVGAEVGAGVADEDSGQVVLSQRGLTELRPSGERDLEGFDVTVSDRRYGVVGVMPSDFAFPDDETRLWLPSAGRSLGYSRIVARLRPGVTLQQAREDADRVRREVNPGGAEVATVTPVGEFQVAGLQRVLMLAVAGAVLVLVVALANVSSLFLGRDAARRNEVAIRSALGATRFQLARVVLLDTGLIAVVAAVVGTVVGVVTLRVLLSQTRDLVPASGVAMALPVIAAIVALTLATALVGGAVRAWHAGQVGAGNVMHSRSVAPHVGRVWRALVVVQIACCSVLLVGAGLLVRTVSVLMAEDHGFDPSRGLEARVVLSDRAFAPDDPGRDSFVPRLLERVRATPGVQYAGFGTSLPPRAPIVTVNVEVRSGEVEESRMLNVAWATPGYLRALGARFVDGRDLVDSDASDRSPGLVLSESAARFLFRDLNPLGRSFPDLPSMFGAAPQSQVVGIVEDIKYDGLDGPPGSTVYLPWGRRSIGKGFLIVRTLRERVNVAATVRRVAAQIDPEIPITEVQSLEQALEGSLVTRRFRALPAMAFGLLGLAVALLGLAATISTWVTERRQDLAIRSALGASPTVLLGAVVRQGLTLTALGLLCGLGVAVAAARTIAAFLYQVSPYDAATFGAAGLIVGLGGALVSCIAALRTREIDGRHLTLHE